MMARSHRREIIAYAGDDLPSQAECPSPSRDSSFCFGGPICPRHHAVLYAGLGALHRAEEGGGEEAQRLLAKEFGATVVHPAPESLL